MQIMEINLSKRQFLHLWGLRDFWNGKDLWKSNPRIHTFPLKAQCYVPRDINHSKPYGKIFKDYNVIVLLNVTYLSDINRYKPYPKIFKDYNVIVLLNVMNRSKPYCKILKLIQCVCIVPGL